MSSYIISIIISIAFYLLYLLLAKIILVSIFTQEHLKIKIWKIILSLIIILIPIVNVIYAITVTACLVIDSITEYTLNPKIENAKFVKFLLKEI
jgi:hypothetical protein